MALTHISLYLIVFPHLHTCSNVCQGHNFQPYLWKKSIATKSLSLDTYPFVCAQLPGKVVSGKAPVAFKSQHWAFPDKNVVHYLRVSFQSARLASANFSKAGCFFVLPLKKSEVSDSHFSNQEQRLVMHDGQQHCRGFHVFGIKELAA